MASLISFIGHSQLTKLLFHPAESGLFHQVALIPLLITRRWHPTESSRTSLTPLASVIKNAPKWWEVVPLSWLRLPNGSRWLVARWESQQVLVTPPCNHPPTSHQIPWDRTEEADAARNSPEWRNLSEQEQGGKWRVLLRRWPSTLEEHQVHWGHFIDFFHWLPEVYTVQWAPWRVENMDTFTNTGRQQYVSFMLYGQESKTE